MDRQKTFENKKELETLCNTVRKLIEIQDYQKCEDIVYDAMGKHPHAPEPHNLTGILLEKKGNHLECYGTFSPSSKCAYDESDCPTEAEKHNNYKLEYDEHGIGRFVRRD